jgi:hypothetical protein
MVLFFLKTLLDASSLTPTIPLIYHSFKGESYSASTVILPLSKVSKSLAGSNSSLSFHKILLSLSSKDIEILSPVFMLKHPRQVSLNLLNCQ